MTDLISYDTQFIHFDDKFALNVIIDKTVLDLLAKVSDHVEIQMDFLHGSMISSIHRYISGQCLQGSQK